MSVVGPADLVSARAVGGCTVPADSNDLLQDKAEHSSQADQASVKICMRGQKMPYKQRMKRWGEML